MSVSSDVAVVLIVVGVVLMLLEILLPGGISGFLGAATLMLALYSLGILSAVWAIVSLAIFTLGLIAFAVPALRSRRYPKAISFEHMIGSEVRATTDIAPEGTVAAQGSLWKAWSERPVHAGEKVRIVGRDGMLLHVEPVEG